MTIADYQKLLIGKSCRWCGQDLSTRSIRSYDHDGGYRVDGHAEPQWLYVKCGCEYEWALWKLDIKEVA